MDSSFGINTPGLIRAVEALNKRPQVRPEPLPSTLPESGIGDDGSLALLAPHVIGRAAQLDAPLAFAHMDPPTPWVSWAAALWNARLNQNLLHPATAPFAREAEAEVIRWLAPFFGMTGGHMTAGATLANLTALWAARELTDIRRVVASEASHISIRKSAHVLGLAYESVSTDDSGRMDPENLPDLSDACLVLTAGTTNAGSIDPLHLTGKAAWTHVDAAWAGPLRISEKYGSRLDGIDNADSVAVSAHKWLFQPKESALVFFKNVDAAHDAVSFGGAYLAVPNVGLQGSHGAAAIPLLATLLAWGRQGLADRIDRCMATAEQVYNSLVSNDGFQVYAPPETGLLLFRPLGENVLSYHAKLPEGLASLTKVAGKDWVRCVAANPNADAEEISRHLVAARVG